MMDLLGVFARFELSLEAVLLASARLVPIAFLCPLFGGPLAPPFVRLGLVLGLSASLCVGGGLSAPASESHFELGVLALREALLGTVIGLLAGVPFEVARTGGRLMDTVRGANAEAVLPGVGSRDSATGDGLHQLLIALAASGPLFMVMISSVWRSFAVMGLGTRAVDEGLAVQLCVFATGALATSLALSGPVVGLSLAIELVTGLLGRAAPSGGFRELSAPLKLLAGGAALWAGLGLVAHRLLLELGLAAKSIPALLGDSN